VPQTLPQEEDMKLKVGALAVAIGLTWGACILFAGIGHLAWPGYGGAFLDLAASIYPGFNPDGGLIDVIMGTVYGLADGAIGGAVVAWLYNAVAGPG